MYRGFNLEFKVTNDHYYKVGLAMFSSNQKETETTLKKFVGKDKILDGSKMQANWFAQINADVFISHSHHDEKKAITLAGWLFEEFELNAFVDSCIWGCANDLLKIIDDDFCFANGYYNYTKRNQSTSHVHMMLSTALGMMIDKTECLFFLNTPSSITASTVIDQTDSPWIYNEIAMTRKTIPERVTLLFESTEIFSEQRQKLEKGGPVVRYNVDLNHLTSLTIEDLDIWDQKYIDGSALDELYKLKPLKYENRYGTKQ